MKERRGTTGNKHGVVREKRDRLLSFVPPEHEADWDPDTQVYERTSTSFFFECFPHSVLLMSAMSGPRERPRSVSGCLLS